ncbi:leucyl aminopeptidase [Proteiniborus ethanoligenes]|uniref:Probable cytosol aminopeptidase n=1 Tax=Proteiniborus ethanoligenes TaxID=415015 RepID=A0A1H3QK86_9FIRM|nr:leucyl aminopeptidase [Proteiniborus ethanoligenes]SDZ14014.1 leucyl aminopeptidase [Proteiniborus ethanoligenes]
MTLEVLTKKASDGFSEAIVLPCFQELEVLKITFPVKEVEEMVKHLISEEEFTGKYNEVQSFKLPKKDYPNKVILLGLGKGEELDLEKIRKASAKAMKEAIGLKAKSVDFYPVEIKEGYSLSQASRAMTEGVLLGSYKFDKYIEDKKENPVKNIYFIGNDIDHIQDLSKGVEEGNILSKATLLARDMVNEPANVLTPAKLASIAEKSGKENGFEVEIFKEDKIQELDMEAFLAVGRASENRPRLIVMRYFGDKESNEIIGLIGKGLTYDSGGLCIKPKDSMVNMKSDMGGAASVVGAMEAIAKRRLKANVVAVVAACENSINGNAYRTGDIIGSMAGKTIFIGSTDAEGRLTLADAIHYAIEKEKVTRVLDIATLTGGAIVALGGGATLVVSNDDEFYEALESASKVTGEKVWRMPAFEEYRELLKSKVADLTNSAGNPQAITAALFVKEFVQDKPWIHMDIAGTAFTSKASEYIAEGGTGVGVRTLYEMVKKLNK